MVLCLTDLNGTSGLLHHVLDNQGLFGLTAKGLVELPASLLNRDMEDLKRPKRRQGIHHRSTLGHHRSTLGQSTLGHHRSTLGHSHTVKDVHWDMLFMG